MPRAAARWGWGSALGPALGANPHQRYPRSGEQQRQQHTLPHREVDSRTDDEEGRHGDHWQYEENPNLAALKFGPRSAQGVARFGHGGQLVPPRIARHKRIVPDAGAVPLPVVDQISTERQIGAGQSKRGDHSAIANAAASVSAVPPTMAAIAITRSPRRRRSTPCPARAKPATRRRPRPTGYHSTTDHQSGSSARSAAPPGRARLAAQDPNPRVRHPNA